MHTEALNCGYPGTSPSLGTSPMSSTSIGSSCYDSSSLYSEPEYQSIDFASISEHDSESRLCASSSPELTPAHTPTETHSFRPPHSGGYASKPHRMDSTSRGKRLSSSKSKLSSSDRKNSFVYDVRLPDEQFLFYVPDLDLVKSHLMFAVREEVDVLKDRIGELLERISQLECENTVLRQHATQEALQQLQQAHHSSNT